jgi:hypothetical protein
MQYEIICYLHQKGADINGTQRWDEQAINCMFYALFHDDARVLEYMLKQAPQQIALALFLCSNIVIENTDIAWRNEERIISKNTIQTGPHRLLTALKEYPTDEKQVQVILEKLIANENDINQLLKFYSDHLQAPYLQKPLEKKMIASLFTTKKYSDLKIFFITELQKKMVQYFLDPKMLEEVTQKQTGTEYVAKCKAALASPLFDKLHEKYGVKTLHRKQLKAKIEEMEHLSKTNRP